MMSISWRAVMYVVIAAFMVNLCGGFVIGLGAGELTPSSGQFLLQAAIVGVMAVVIGAFAVRFAGNMERSTAMYSAMTGFLIFFAISSMLTTSVLGASPEAALTLLCSPGTILMLLIAGAVAYAAARPSGQMGRIANVPFGTPTRVDSSPREVKTSSDVVSNLLGLPEVCPKCGVSMRESNVNWVAPLKAVCSNCGTIVTGGDEA